MKKKIRTFLREAFDHYFEVRKNDDDLDGNFLRGYLYGIKVILVIFYRVFEVSEKEVERGRHEAKRG